MIKYNHQSKARRFDNKVQGAAPFYQDKMPAETNEPAELEDMKIKKVSNDSSIQTRNYQTNHKKENLFWIIG